MHTLIQLLVLVLVLVPASLARAADSETLYQLDVSKQIDLEEISIEAAVEAVAINLDPKLVAENPERFEFELLDGRRLEAQRQYFTVYGPRYASWSGEARWTGGTRKTTDTPGHIHLVFHGDHITGILNLKTERFQIVPSRDGDHALVRIDPSQPAGCALAGKERETSLPRIPEFHVPADPASAGAPKAITYIDVLALYVSALSSSVWTEQQAVTFIEGSLADANDIFQRSGINVRYRLAHIGPILEQQPPSTSIVTIWQWLNGEPQEVQQIRNASGADMVALFVPRSYDGYRVCVPGEGCVSPCGVANLPKANGGIVGGSGQFGQRAFSVMRSGCGRNDYTFAHELGHNYGMRHDDEDTGSSHLFPNGRGYVLVEDSMATVMGCTGFEIGEDPVNSVCNRIPHFSDPNISYQGRATGTSNRRNADVARARAASYANFRPPSPGCIGNSTTLCLQGGRFKVELDYVQGGSTSKAKVRTYSNLGGFFWFSNSSNIEVAVKIIDGRSVNGRWWVYHGAMTSLEYTVRITDTETGRVKTYQRPSSGTVSCGGSDTSAFTKSAQPPIGAGTMMPLGQDLVPDLNKASCVPNASRLCLLGNRFQVEVKRGSANQPGVKLTDQSGSFWFFNSANPEVPVKVIDGRAVNGKYWVFFGSLTNQSFQVKVTDTVSGLTKTYSSPSAHCGTLDTSAF